MVVEPERSFRLLPRELQRDEGGPVGREEPADVVARDAHAADADAADGPVVELAPIVAQIRQRWPDTKILVRGHSGFCCKHIMAWCERQGVDYVFGLGDRSRGW